MSTSASTLLTSAIPRMLISVTSMACTWLSTSSHAIELESQKPSTYLLGEAVRAGEEISVQQALELLQESIEDREEHHRSFFRCIIQTSGRPRKHAVETETA
ncbi:MAG: hypothetical protein WA383_20050 [Terriglobales bacterium]